MGRLEVCEFNDDQGVRRPISFDRLAGAAANQVSSTESCNSALSERTISIQRGLVVNPVELSDYISCHRSILASSTHFPSFCGVPLFRASQLGWKGLFTHHVS